MLTLRHGSKRDVFLDKKEIQQSSPPQTFYDRAKEFGTKTSDFLFGGEKVTPWQVLQS